EDELERPSKIINRSILNNPEVTQTFIQVQILIIFINVYTVLVDHLIIILNDLYSQQILRK
ncbi:MULE domain-containing protein, partial [Aphis craccivora]